MTSYVSPVVFTTVAQSIPPNVFADMDRKVAAAVAGGADVSRLIGRRSFLPWKARSMVWLRCSPCWFPRAMLWHMRIRITLRTIA